MDWHNDSNKPAEFRQDVAAIGYQSFGAHVGADAPNPITKQSESVKAGPHKQEDLPQETKELAIKILAHAGCYKRKSSQLSNALAQKFKGTGQQLHTPPLWTGSVNRFMTNSNKDNVAINLRRKSIATKSTLTLPTRMLSLFIWPTLSSISCMLSGPVLQNTVAHLLAAWAIRFTLLTSVEAPIKSIICWAGIPSKFFLKI